MSSSPDGASRTAAAALALALGAILGIASRRRLAPAAVGFAGFAVLGVLASSQLPGASPAPTGVASPSLAGDVQTATRTDVAPDGASGHHAIRVDVRT